MLQPNGKFGKYKIHQILGKGGMGQVYLAKDYTLERSVALKILHTNIPEQQIQRFSQEAKIISALNHPNILTIYEIGEYEGLKYIASEFINGKTLSESLKNENFSLERILDISIQIISAINTAHQAGIIHRDIKPENLMIREDDIVKVLDFGLAKLVETADNSTPLTLEGEIVGTPNYMSPEQAEGEFVDERTDLWSFGTVLYELLTSKKAFWGETIAQTVLSVLLSEPDPINEINKEVPTELSNIIEKLLKKTPNERYQTANDLAFELEELKKQNLIKKEIKNSNLSITTEPKNEKPITSNNLPKDLPNLIGRNKEIKEICDLLNREDVRLLTLTGIGGTGKTRLSQEIGFELLDTFSDGVFFVELADISNPDLTALTIAQTFGIQEKSEESTFEVLKEYLEEKKSLLILDNFEQIISASSIVKKLLLNSQHLKILVTSRFLLQLSNENEYKVSPLDLPSKKANFDDLSVNESVKLFIERAISSNPRFEVDEENISSIVEICKRLDGLPLAIEFAAARSKILTPQSILTKLDLPLKLLKDNTNDLPSRRQTMRGTIKWSYDLLDEKEKIVFRGLAVFIGGFSFEAAEAVVGSEEGFSEFEVLEALTSLLDKSLLIIKESFNNEPRFKMLKVVHEFALEELQTNREFESVKNNHADYFLKFAQEAEPNLTPLTSIKWLNLLEQENDNLRSTLNWLFEKNAEKAINLVAALKDFWIIHNHYLEGYKWLTMALQQTITIPPKTRFTLLYALGWLSIRQGKYSRARKIFEEGLLEAQSSKNLEQVAMVNRAIGKVNFHQGDFEKAHYFYEKSLTFSRKINKGFRIASSLISLGNLALILNKPPEARSLFEESLEIARRENLKQLVISSLINLASTYFYLNNFKEAKKCYKECLNLALEAGQTIVILYAINGFAALSVNDNNFEKAAKLSGKADSLLNSISAKLEPVEKRFRDSYMEKLQSTLAPNEFDKFYQNGYQLSLDEAIKLID